MSKNESISATRLMDAYTNNTFNLEEAETAIKTTIENSFQYLKKLQKSYVGINRFNLTEKDLFVNKEGIPSITVNKDFIDLTKRKKYKTSQFYTKWISFNDILVNRDIFTLIPLIFINGSFISNFNVKTTVDGNTDFEFPFISSNYLVLEEERSIDVVFLKSVEFNSFTTNKYVIDKYLWKLPESITNMKLKPNDDVIITMIGKTKNYGSNLIGTTVTENGELILDNNNESVMEILSNNSEVSIFVLSSDSLFKLSTPKQIKKRVDNDSLSAIAVINPDEDDTKEYSMPIHPNSLIILRKDKETGVTTYENNLDVELHYPNIYEIHSDLDETKYEYIVYYFYTQLSDYLKYTNMFKFIHKFYKDKLNASSIEDAICKLLYEKQELDYLQKFFFSFFDYEDAEFVYDNGDFFNTKAPYDFDYKIEKMKEIVNNDPTILINYAKSVSVPSDVFFLDVRNIDLSSRVRMDTTQEATSSSDYHYFDEPHYVFKFRNEFADNLDLRFFIDGLAYLNYYSLKIVNVDYIYIPVSRINEDSYIEVEQFHPYSKLDIVTITDKETPVKLEYDNYEYVVPTLFDLFVTDSEANKIDRSKFKIYCSIDDNNYDMSDTVNEEVKPETVIVDGEFYVNINDVGFINISKSRIPVKYMVLDKILIYANDDSVLNKELHFVINKLPYTYTEIMSIKGLPEVKLFDGRKVPWKEASNFLRIFINGRFAPIHVRIEETTSPAETILVPNCFVEEGDEFTVDITPYGNELEFSLKNVPSSYVVDFEGKLSKPFDLDYYDVYLNGRKLSERNIQVISNNKIALFNVKSAKNFLVYRKDRDCEFFGFTKTVLSPLDSLLNSKEFSEEDKSSIINSIISSTHPGETIKPGEDTEPDTDIYIDIDNDSYDYYRFYHDVILKTAIIKPYVTEFDPSEISTKYPAVYEKHSNKKDRLVMKPNVGHDTHVLLKIGRESEEYNPRS